MVGVLQTGLGDATGWCKELKALPILNLPVTWTAFSTGFSTKLLKNNFDNITDRKHDAGEKTVKLLGDSQN